MEDLIESVTRGNPTEVKVILGSIAMVLGIYQLLLISIGYDKLRLPFMKPTAASRSHRAIGDTLAVIILVVAVMCIGYFGFEDDAVVHSMAGTGLLVALALKIATVRGWTRLDRFLPALGITVWLLLAVAWFTSAGDFLINGPEGD